MLKCVLTLRKCQVLSNLVLFPCPDYCFKIGTITSVFLDVPGNVAVLQNWISHVAVAGS